MTSKARPRRRQGSATTRHRKGGGERERGARARDDSGRRSLRLCVDFGGSRWRPLPARGDRELHGLASPGPLPGSRDELVGDAPEWLRFRPCQRFDNLSLYMTVDPSGGKRPGQAGKRGTGDYTSIWVIGVGTDANIYVCDHLRDRLNLTGRCRAVMALHRKWHQPAHRIQKVGYEEYGMQADIEALNWLQEHENYRFDDTPLSGTKLTKADRIKCMVPSGTSSTGSTTRSPASSASTPRSTPST